MASGQTLGPPPPPPPPLLPDLQPQAPEPRDWTQPEVTQGVVTDLPCPPRSSCRLAPARCTDTRGQGQGRSCVSHPVSLLELSVCQNPVASSDPEVGTPRGQQHPPPGRPGPFSHDSCTRARCGCALRTGSRPHSTGPLRTSGGTSLSQPPWKSPCKRQRPGSPRGSSQGLSLATLTSLTPLSSIRFQPNPHRNQLHRGRTVFDILFSFPFLVFQDKQSMLF